MTMMKMTMMVIMTMLELTPVKVMETVVEYQVTRLQGQTMIWVGSEGNLSALAAAVPVGDCPSTSLLPGSEQSQGLASRLAKKLNKQVFVSYNLKDDVLMTPLVIARLVEEIKSNPDKF